MLRLIPLLIVAAIAGCSSDSPSCELTSNAGELLVCIEYADAIADKDAKASCESGGGTWQDSSCDSFGAVARCDAFGSSSWYYDGYLTDTGITIAELETTCVQMSGAFTEL